MYCRLNCTTFFTTYFNMYCTLYCKSYCTKMAYSFRKTTFPASSSMYCRLKIFLFLTHSNVNYQSFSVFNVCLHWPHLKLLSTWTKVLSSKLELLLYKALYFLAWISFRLLAFLLRAEDLRFFFFSDWVACVPTLVSREKEKLGSRFRVNLFL